MSSSILLRFGCHRFLVAFECGHDSVPGEDGALHARGILVNAREHRQLAYVAFNLAIRNHFVDLAEHCFHVGLGLAFRKFREQRRRRLRDATAGANEADVFDGPVVQREEELELVAAKRVVALRGTTGLRHLMEIPRLLAVVENDLLIKVVQVVEHARSIVEK